jgi:TRAP-type C4-dicarboxylate transport system substrate-binding protein
LKSSRIKVLFFITLLVVLLVSLVACGDDSTTAEPTIKIVYSHFEAAQGHGGMTATKFAEELEEKSGGRVEVELALANALGPMNQQFDIVKTGMADIACFLPAQTPGRFHALSITDLPVKAMKVEPVSASYMELGKKGYFDKEMEPDVEFLFASCTTPLQILFTDPTPVTMDEIKGKKIRVSNDYWFKAAERMGWVPVNVPITDAYASLEKGIVEGALGNYGMLDAWNWGEVIRSIGQFNLAYAAFVTVINKDSYDSWPADIQDLVKELGEKYAIYEAKLHDDHGAEQKDDWLATYPEANIYTFTDSEWNSMAEKLKPTYDEWVTAITEKGYNGQQILDDYETALKSNGISDPFIR